MKALLISIYLLAFSIVGSSQIDVSGTITNGETGEPVPYAYVKKKRTNRGAITNEDGYFQLTGNVDDTLVISFVSYQKKEIPITYFIENDRCELFPSINELSTVEIYANFDFLYALFDRSRKNLKRTSDRDNKTYFSLETSSESMPVELLECYYNTETGPSGINSIELKNGRVGMSPQNGIYYASLHTTQVISDYRLLSRGKNRFPSNPLQLNKSKLEKVYYLNLLAYEDGIYKVNFVPKKRSKNDLFNATVWINEKKEQLVQVDLYRKNLKMHPFMVIDPKHKMDSLDFFISYSFSDDEIYSLDKIEFKYSLDYDNGENSRKMTTGGLFVFFEKDAGFDLPYYSETGYELSDYDKIVTQPYNASFWKNNEVITPSIKALQYRNYFQKNGVLLNFDKLSTYSNTNFFKNRLVEWSTDRVLLEQINQEGNYSVSLRNDVYRTKVLSSFYNLSAHIYLDRNKHNDSVYYLSRTLVDLEDSFYYLEPNKNTTCMLNLYYDLVEMERRFMMEVLESRYWEKTQVDSIYQVSQNRLNATLERFLTDIYHGTNDVAIEKYNKAVEQNLGIDNSLLIWSDFMADQKKVPDQSEESEWIRLYNYGTALLQIGKYKEALPVLLEAYESGSQDPWLVYNIGLTYIKLGNMEKGCAFLKQSKEMGEEVPKELISECE